MTDHELNSFAEEHARQRLNKKERNAVLRAANVPIGPDDREGKVYRRAFREACERLTHERLSRQSEHLPRFLIDDTAGISDAQIFVIHTQTPRFIGELVPEDEASPLGQIELTGLPLRQVLTNIVWFDDSSFDPNELIPSLAKAIERHDAIRYPHET